MLGERMKNLRRLAGLHIGEVARELGVHRNTVQRWEGGQGKRGIPISVGAEFDRLVNDIERINRMRAGRRRVRRIRGGQ